MGNVTFLVWFWEVSKRQVVFLNERVDVWRWVDQHVPFWAWFWEVSKRQLVVLCRMSRVCKEQVYVWRRVDQKVKWLARFWKVSKMQLVGIVTFLARFGRYQRDDWWKLSRCWLCFNIVQRDNWWFCVACREFLVMGDGGWCRTGKRAAQQLHPPMSDVWWKSMVLHCLLRMVL